MIAEFLHGTCEESHAQSFVARLFIEHAREVAKPLATRKC
jgi:hypothetical protein